MSAVSASLYQVQDGEDGPLCVYENRREEEEEEEEEETAQQYIRPRLLRKMK